MCGISGGGACGVIVMCCSIGGLVHSGVALGALEESGACQSSSVPETGGFSLESGVKMSKSSSITSIKRSRSATLNGIKWASWRERTFLLLGW